MDHIIDHIRSKLKKHAEIKKVAAENLDTCILLYIQLANGNIYILTIRYDELLNIYYGKVLDGRFIDRYDCEYIEYNPYGQYIFADNIDTFTEKIPLKIKKIEKIIKRSSGGS
jgi:hypothetical protein